MVIIGIIAGLLAGAAFERDAWIYCAVFGGIAGWLVQRLRDAQRELAQLQRRLDALESRSVPSSGVAPSGAAASGRVTAGMAGAVAAAVPDAPARVPAPVAPPEAAAVHPAAPLPVSSPERPAMAAAAARAPLAMPAAPARVSAPASVPAPHPALSWLLGGNTLVRAGVVILFFGVAFLLKFAYEHSHVPVEARLAGVCLGAMALLGIGWRLRLRRPGYALTLQGGGVGLLYLTIFAALRLYAVVPAQAAFVLLVLVAGCAAVLAVLQDALALAVIGVCGGFLAPILASTGGGSHVMLFSFYLVLNLGILAVAWNKPWRVLNVIGFAFTFVIGLLWGLRFYRPEYLASVEPFLGIFFLLYVLIPLRFAHHQADRLAPYVDATLVFGVPAAAFGLQAALVRDIAYGMAWSALALGAFYLVLASALWRRAGPARRLLTESYLAIGSALATLCVPLAFDGRVTSAVWAVEGAAVVWVGLRQHRPLARAVGYALQLAAGIAFALGMGPDIAAGAGFAGFDRDLLGYALMAAGAWFCSACVSRAMHRAPSAVGASEALLPVILFAWGASWWLAGGLRAIDRHVDAWLSVHAALAYVAVSAGVLGVLARALAWPPARWAGYALLPAMGVVLLIDAAAARHPLADLGYLAWPLALGVHWRHLLRNAGADTRLQSVLHPGAVWIAVAVLTTDAVWQADKAVGGGGVWGLVVLGLVPAAALWLLQSVALLRRWPVAAEPASYRVVAVMPVWAFLLLWSLGANLAGDGNPAPLPYLPLLNPLDLAQAAVLLTLLQALLRMRRDGVQGVPVPALPWRGLQALVGAAAFACANGMLLRCVHQWAGVSYNAQALWQSVLVQACLSIFWSLAALLLMALAARRRLRELWLCGAVLMGIVVLKLFAVDLSDVGGVARIVSFIGVGALMLVIGYVAPVPPRVPEVSAPAAKEPA